jgi:PIN domain nuclease of toxin-antitoxin system
VVVWLYTAQIRRLPKRVQDTIEAEELAISPMVQLELDFLFEIGRTTEPGMRVVADLADRLDLRLAEAPLRVVVQAAAALTWTRDPFDRLIAAQAIAEGTRLLTKDPVLRKHCRLATWA